MNGIMSHMRSCWCCCRARQC